MYKKKLITWDNYGRLLNILKTKIVELNIPFDYIYGIPRGGLPISTFLSHNLEKDLIFLATVEHKQILLVDDISDTGKTFIKYKTIFEQKNKVITASLHMKPHSKFKPDTIVQLVNNNEWIVYPYEQYTEKPNR